MVDERINLSDCWRIVGFRSRAYFYGSPGRAENRGWIVYGLRFSGNEFTTTFSMRFSVPQIVPDYKLKPEFFLNIKHNI